MQFLLLRPLDDSEEVLHREGDEGVPTCLHLGDVDEAVGAEDRPREPELHARNLVDLEVVPA